MSREAVVDLAFRAAKVWGDNSDSVTTVPAKTISSIIKYVEELEEKVQYYVSDAEDGVKEILLEITDILECADDDYYGRQDDMWWIDRLRKIVRGHI